MRRPLRSWKNLLGMLGLQVVERASAPRPAKRQRSFESLEDRSMMATLYWDTNGTTPGLGGAGTWDLSAANWTSDPTGTSATQAWNNAAGDDAVFSGTGAAVTLGSGIQAASLKIEANGFTLGGGSLAVNGTGEVNVATGISTTISTQLTGSTELRKTGTGTLTLSGNNTLSGGTKLEAGTVAVNHNNALGSGTITLAGGKLQAGNGARTLSNAIVAAAATTSEVVSPTNNNLTLNGNLSGTGTIWKTGAFSVFLGGDNSGFAGTLSHRQSNFYFNTATAASAAATWDITGGNQFAANFAGAGTLQFGSLAGTTGAIHGGGGSGAKVWEIGALNTSTSYAGTIAGSTVSLVKTGTGTLSLGGSNTFTAGSTLSNGILVVSHNSALGTGAITLAGGKLQSGSAARTLSNSIVAAAGTVSELISPTSFNLTLNGNLTGTGTIIKSGGFSVFLGGDNTAFAGAFSNRQSNVFLNTPNSASALAAWDITGGDMLVMNFTGDGTVQLGSLAGTTGRIISGITNGTKTLEIGALNSTTTYNGTIQNHSTTTTATTVAVVKKGNGTLTLGGRNTFTNDLTIDAGTLILANNNNDGTSKAGKGTITVRNGATLRVAGNNVFGTGVNLPSEVALESGSTLELIGAFYSQLPHVTMSSAVITSGAGSASYGSWAFMGGISAVGATTSTITGENMYIPATVAIDITAGTVLKMTATFEGTSAYGESTIIKNGAGELIRFGNLVVNGSFEDYNVSTGSYMLFAEIPGWELLRGDRFEIQDNIGVLGGAAEGTQQHLELDSNDGSSDVGQTIEHLIPGAVYSVSFAYRGRPNRSSIDNQLQFQLLDGNTPFRTENIPATDTNRWTTWTGTFTAPSSIVKLAFRDTGTWNSYGAFVDEVYCALAEPAIDLDIDSNNDSGFDVPDENATEENNEELDAKAKYVIAYGGDLDKDNKKDTIDFNGIDGAKFVPIAIRIPVALKNMKIELQDITLKFEYAAGAFDTALRIWTMDATENRESAGLPGTATGLPDPDKFVESGKEYSAKKLKFDFGDNKLYVEAIDGSTENVSITISASYRDGLADKSLGTDKVLVAPVLIKSEEIKWSAASGDLVPLRMDSDTIDSPNTDDSPIAFVRQSLIATERKFQIIAPAQFISNGLNNQTAVKGQGTNDYNFTTIKSEATPDRTDGYSFSVTTSNGKTYLTSSSRASKALSENIEHYNPLTVTWTILVSGQEYSVTTTKTPLFTFYAKPEAKLFVTVAYTATLFAKHGDPNAKQLHEIDKIQEAVWKTFSFENLNLTNQDGTKSLKYSHGEGILATTQGLIYTGDGPCGAWANFLVDAFTSQGIKAEFFTVKPKLPDPPAGPDGYTFNKTYLTVPEQNAQGRKNYQRVKFFDHAIVKIKDQNTIYDPSYGQMYSGTVTEAETLFEASLFGFGYQYKKGDLEHLEPIANSNDKQIDIKPGQEILP